MAATLEAAKPSDALRKDLVFLQKLLAGARSVDEYLVAANAAAQIASRAADLAAKRARATEVLTLTIKGLPATQEWGWRTMRAWLDKQGIAGIRACDKDMKLDLAVVHFHTDKDREAGEATLNAAPPVEGGVALSITHGEAPEYSRDYKRARQIQQEQASGKVPIPNICDAVCPLATMPYGQQLREKLARVSGALSRVTQAVERFIPPGRRTGWLAAARPAGVSRDAACPACPIEGILRSPVLERYRNKNEFTIGMNGENQPCVGFLLGAFRDGFTQVEEPTPTRHTSKVALQYAAITQRYVREHSSLRVWEKRDNKGGFWRLLVVREGRVHTFLPLPAPAAGTPGQVIEKPVLAEVEPGLWKITSEQLPASGSSPLAEDEPEAPTPDDVMLVVQVNHTFSDAATRTKECHALTAYLREQAAAQGLPLTCLRFQHHSGVANVAPVEAPLVLPPGEEATATAADAMHAGESADAAGVGAEGSSSSSAAAGSGGGAYIHDSLGGLRFRISPVAFFQVNSAAACVLYKQVADWAAPSANTLLLDVCCGTGTIGLTMAHKVAKVIGIDNVTPAIEDAHHNAALNNILNAEFVCGKAEDALPLILAKHASSSSGDGHQEVVAVVDPPRAGLHKSVIRALMACKPLKRLVYVSCNPESLADNMVQLCTPARPGDVNRAFTPVKALAMDLFPHTHHVEAVVLLERQ